MKYKEIEKKDGSKYLFYDDDDNLIAKVEDDKLITYGNVSVAEVKEIKKIASLD